MDTKKKKYSSRRCLNPTQSFSLTYFLLFRYKRKKKLKRKKFFLPVFLFLWKWRFRAFFYTIFLQIWIYFFAFNFFLYPWWYFLLYFNVTPETVALWEIKRDPPFFFLWNEITWKIAFQVDLRHMDEKAGSNVVEVGVDLSEFYMSVEWDILEVPAVR